MQFEFESFYRFVLLMHVIMNFLTLLLCHSTGLNKPAQGTSQHWLVNEDFTRTFVPLIAGFGKCAVGELRWQEEIARFCGKGSIILAIKMELHPS